jgi:hypothetical protein
MFYTIIGGDGKEYGPVTGDDVQQWIAEGRLNAQSRAKSESDAEFRELAQFPELAEALKTSAERAPSPIAPLGADGGRATALEKVKAPAIGLIVTAAVNIILCVWSLFSRPDAEQIQEFNTKIQQLNNPQIEQIFHKGIAMLNGPLAIANGIFELAISTLILIGAIKMLSLRSYGFAFAAAVLAVLPCVTPCCGFLIGIAFGIWSLIVLNKPEVKSHFK